MRSKPLVIALVVMVASIGGGMIAVRGGDSNETSPGVGTGPTAEQLTWAVEAEYPFRWTENLPSEQSSKCPNGEGLKDCLIKWGVGRLDGSLEALDEVIIAISLRTLGERSFYDGPCHDVWHDVGEAAGELYDLETIVKYGPDMCHGGLLHGAMNTRAVRLGREAFWEEARDLCRLYDGWPEIMVNDCYHGIGHGFGYLENWETFFDGCNTTGLTGEAYDWCAAGVMETVVERISRENLRASGKDPVAYDSLCRRLDREKDACWRYIIFPLLGSGLSLAEIAQRCEVGEVADALRCSFAVGGVAASGWEHGSEDLDLCRSMPGARGDECWMGAARSITRGTERAGTDSPRADDLPDGWRLSLCKMVPGHLHSWCADMEERELGDQTDQLAQAELAAQWRERFGLSWPYQSA
jgi:hypothetical protein